MDRKLFAIVLLAMALRLVPLFAIMLNSGYGALYQNDSDEYIAMGHALAEGDFLFSGQRAPWQPLFRTPGYPLFLAFFYAIGLPDAQVAFAQALLDAASCVLVFHLTMCISRGKGQAYAAAALFAANPLFMAYSFQLLSETFFLFVFLLANIVFFGALRKEPFGPRDAALLGALFGFLILIRPASIAFPLIYALVIYAGGRSLRGPALLLGVSAIFVLAWMGRNYLVDGEFVLSGTALWNIVCYYAGFVANDPASMLEGHGYTIWRYMLWDPARCTELPYAELKSALVPALELIGDNALVFARHSLIGWMLLFDPFNPAGHIGGALSGMRPPDIERMMLSRSGEYLWFLPVYAFALAYQMSVYSLAAVHLWRPESRKGPLFLLFAMLLAYTFIANGPLNYARYRFPIEPFIIVFASSGLWAIERCRRFLSCPG